MTSVISLGWAARPSSVSTDNILETNEFRDSVGAQWTFLSDADRHVQKDLDIQEYTDPHHDPMIPYTLVLKPGLVIHSIYNGYWFWGRPSDLRRDLREVTREIRPDWDLAEPGLRVAWEAGDRSSSAHGSSPPRPPPRESASRVVDAATIIPSTDSGVSAATHSGWPCSTTSRCMCRKETVPAISASIPTHPIMIRRIHRSGRPLTGALAGQAHR
jgi:hypothetical protein